MYKKTFLFVFIIILLAIFIVTGAFLIKNKLPYEINLQTSKNQITKEDLEQAVKKTFTKAQDKDIVKFVAFATKDRTLETKFVDYSKAYQLIYNRYQYNATPEIKQVMLKMRAFLKTFPGFRETSFKLPK